MTALGFSSHINSFQYMHLYLSSSLFLSPYMIVMSLLVFVPFSDVVACFVPFSDVGGRQMEGALSPLLVHYSCLIPATTSTSCGRFTDMFNLLYLEQVWFLGFQVHIFLIRVWTSIQTHLIHVFIHRSYSLSSGNDYIRTVQRLCTDWHFVASRYYKSTAKAQEFEFQGEIEERVAKL